MSMLVETEIVKNASLCTSTQCFLQRVWFSCSRYGHTIFWISFDLPIPNFMVVRIIILIHISFLNHILIYLASIDIYFGSFDSTKGCRFGCDRGSKGQATHFMYTPLFSYFTKSCFIFLPKLFCEKKLI